MFYDKGVNTNLICVFVSFKSATILNSSQKHHEVVCVLTHHWIGEVNHFLLVPAIKVCHIAYSVISIGLYFH